MTEDFTPSIHIEPPPDSDEQGLFNFTSGLFDNNSYCAPSEHDTHFTMADRCYPSAPALFIQSSDSTSVSELSPLDEFPFLPDYRYSPTNSGRSSPIGEAWSPVSSFSGDIFPEDLSPDEFAASSWSQQGLSGHSSPALSPLTSAFDGFRFEEAYPAAERSVLPNGPPTVTRLRSSSHSIQGVSPTEVWVDGVGRGRSASFSAPTTDNQEFVQLSSADVEATLSQPPMFWGTDSHGNATGDNMALGTLAPEWRASPPSPSDGLLTVPTVGLQRRPACAMRQALRSRLSSPPDQDLGRGRGQHRSTLSIPNSRSVSNGSRATSRDASPHGALFFNDLSSSPAFEDAETGDEGVSVGRRRTFTALRGADELHTPISALSLFKAVKTETSMASFLSPQGSDGSQQEFRVTQPQPAPTFKTEVASKKIRQASSARRINAATFAPINSHNKYRPHRCMCGMSFTTQGVLNRHKKRCRK
ncbi:hypothetical protein B0H13DRAFT_2041938 [Mycena leptocephala]|nr:hypothetical protein B0H13DRAFT_2041938 [Mycena leptocephala]